MIRTLMGLFALVMIAEAKAQLVTDNRRGAIEAFLQCEEMSKQLSKQLRQLSNFSGLSSIKEIELIAEKGNTLPVNVSRGIGGVSSLIMPQEDKFLSSLEMEILSKFSKQGANVLQKIQKISGMVDRLNPGGKMSAGQLDLIKNEMRKSLGDSVDCVFQMQEAISEFSQFTNYSNGTR